MTSSSLCLRVHSRKYYREQPSSSIITLSFLNTSTEIEQQLTVLAKRKALKTFYIEAWKLPPSVVQQAQIRVPLEEHCFPSFDKMMRICFLLLTLLVSFGTASCPSGNWHKFAALSIFIYFLITTSRRA